MPLDKRAKILFLLLNIMQRLLNFLYQGDLLFQYAVYMHTESDIWVKIS